MARYSGTADICDINVALQLAIKAAKQGLGSDIVTWVLIVAFGANNAGKNDLTVEIEASVP